MISEKNIMQTDFGGKSILHSKHISIMAYNAETFLCCIDRFDNVIRILSPEILGKKVLIQTK